MHSRRGRGGSTTHMHSRELCNWLQEEQVADMAPPLSQARTLRQPYALHLVAQIQNGLLLLLLG